MKRNVFFICFIVAMCFAAIGAAHIINAISIPAFRATIAMGALISLIITLVVVIDSI